MRIGILGGGQLGRMLALAGYPLGLEFRFFDPQPDATAGRIAPLCVGDYRDSKALVSFAAGLDVITYEFENVPVAAARSIESVTPIHPATSALKIAQDRLREKTFFRSNGVPTAGFTPIERIEDLRRAWHDFSEPAILKTRRLGYDGKGQFVINRAEEIDAAWSSVGGVPSIIEEFVRFDREVSLIAVRGRTGETAFYPLVENHHREGILRLSLAPAPAITPELQRQAEAYAESLLRALDYVGTLAIEFFQQGDQLIANEMAPRVHNSGHWTIEGAETSQFENHLRAIAGLPLGETSTRGQVAMVNLIGSFPARERVLAVPCAHLHDYQKEPRAGRKIGHITIRHDDPVILQGLLSQIISAVD